MNALTTTCCGLLCWPQVGERWIGRRNVGLGGGTLNWTEEGRAGRREEEESKCACVPRVPESKREGECVRG